MANNAHLINTTRGNPTIEVRDDRGAPIIEVELPEQNSPEQIDEELRAAGWSRSADWATASDGWVAPVVPS